MMSMQTCEPVVVGMSLFKTLPDWGCKLELFGALPLQVHVSTTHQLDAEMEALTTGALHIQVHTIP